MSRSYKKTPVSKDRSPWAKRQANKKVRRYKKGLKNGKSYRKVYCSWDISDYKSRSTLNEHLKFEERDMTRSFYGYYFKKEPFDREKEIQQWKKWYYWK